MQPTHLLGNTFERRAQRLPSPPAYLICACIISKKLNPAQVVLRRPLTPPTGGIRRGLSTTNLDSGEPRPAADHRSVLSQVSECDCRPGCRPGWIGRSDPVLPSLQCRRELVPE